METLMLSTQFFKDDFKPVETKINVKQPDFDMPDNVKGLTQKLLEIINQKRNTFLSTLLC